MIEELKKEVAALEERFVSDEPTVDVDKDGKPAEDPSLSDQEASQNDSPKEKEEMKPKEELLLAIDVAMEGLALAKKIIDAVNDENAEEVLDDEACEKFEDLMDFVEDLDSKMDDILDTGDDSEDQEIETDSEDKEEIDSDEDQEGPEEEGSDEELDDEDSEEEEE